MKKRKRKFLLNNMKSEVDWNQNVYTNLLGLGLLTALTNVLNLKDSILYIKAYICFKLMLVLPLSISKYYPDLHILLKSRSLQESSSSGPHPIRNHNNSLGPRVTLDPWLTFFSYCSFEHSWCALCYELNFKTAMLLLITWVIIYEQFDFFVTIVYECC